MCVWKERERERETEREREREMKQHTWAPSHTMYLDPKCAGISGFGHTTIIPPPKTNISLAWAKAPQGVLFLGGGS